MFFHTLITTLLFAMIARASDCDAEMVKREEGSSDSSEIPVDRHIGPVTVASLNLTGVFDCLQSLSNTNMTIGYKAVETGVWVNITLEDLVELTDEVFNTCFNENQHGLNQLDYLIFVDGHDTGYTDLRLATDDNSIVRSGIRDGLGIISDGTMTLGETDDEIDTSSGLTKRDDDMTIGFSASSYQGGIYCNAVAGSCVSRCKATNAIGMATRRSGIHYATSWSHHQCIYKGRDDYKYTRAVSHAGTTYWTYGSDQYWLYSGGMSSSQQGNYWGDGRSQRVCGVWN